MNQNIPNDGNDFEADQLERFIDGMMSDAEAEEFLAMNDNADLAISERDLQLKIDDSLRRSFGLNDAEKEAIVSSAEAEIHGTQSDGEVGTKSQLPQAGSFRENPLFKLAIAASLLFLIGASAWSMGGFGRQITPHFKPIPVVKIYNEINERGFRPYYNCEDDQRFADTFEFRQGIPLALAELPQGRRMLGISYPGGISRNTTAMLAEADGNRVMVFVDTAANKSELEVAAVNDDQKLNVFVVERGGLIFCEVSALESPEFIKHFEIVDQSK